MAGCHSNALYDALRTTALQLHTKGANIKNTKHEEERKVAAFSLMSANVSVSTEVIACLQCDAPSEGSCR